MIEDEELSCYRNVALDVQATMHMMESYKSGEKEWICRCMACQYIRKSPQVMQAIARAVVKECGNRSST